MIFHRHKERDHFIPKPQYDPRVHFLTDLYKLVNYPPIPLTKFVEAGVDRPCKQLNIMAIRVITNSIYQLYAYPAVRKYYGDEFVHGCSALLDPVSGRIHYVNIDDSDEAEYFLLELTLILSKVFEIFLERYDIYIFADGEYLSFVTAEEMKRIKKRHVEGRIVWV